MRPRSLEFAHEQARHDRLAGTGLIGEQEAHAGQLEEVLVDRFELVRQRVHSRDGKLGLPRFSGQFLV